MVSKIDSNTINTYKSKKILITQNVCGRITQNFAETMHRGIYYSLPKMFIICLIVYEMWQRLSFLQKNFIKIILCMIAMATCMVIKKYILIKNDICI